MKALFVFLICVVGAVVPGRSQVHWETARALNQVAVTSVAADPASGDTYVTGSFSTQISFTSPYPGGKKTMVPVGRADLFVARLDAAGNLIWVRQVGGAGASAYGSRIAFDGIGSVYVVGSFTGTLTVNTGAASTVASPIFAAVLVLRCSASSGTTLWSRGIGNDLDYSEGKSIAMKPGASIFYIGGRLGGGSTIDFGPVRVSPGRRTGFVAAYNVVGEAQWVTLGNHDGGVYGSRVNEVAVDDAGNCFATGFFSSALELGGLRLPDSNSPSQTFVARLQAATGVASWLKASKKPSLAFGTNDVSMGTGLAVYGKECYLAGTFKGNEIFDGTALFAGTTMTGYVARLNAGSGSQTWIQPVGNVSTAFGYTNTGVTLAANVNRVVAAWGTETVSRYSVLAAFSPAGALQWRLASGGPGSNGASDVALLGDQAVYWTGNFESSGVFGPFTLTGPASPVSGFWARLTLDPLRTSSPRLPAAPLALFPNPVVDELHVTGAGSATDPVRLTVYSALGKPVLLHELNETDYKLNVRSWPRGTYWVALESNSMHELRQIHLK
ncbi:T9SS type A sorting domain-containing protein [Hymenobacter busanensis]|uniref:T9SS type A sorting domain-containing protein n=1 Tax=Hymenobacter busanensis TaxID=2607656 RepID=A0A7L4ZVU6_9BACT|nr:T9SS type A sorting domain-containing protein [Hymenobacter busanensis]KAA9325818.1 T9SS type A sorting domain-containing protein [Hymenobacter busanensis]QHJ06342.1 T9SS type A sorting domain-containing protein [Hymenobacter busanensis]